MSSKRYYWIKLKTNFFDQDEIDFLLSQKNGCEYVVLYQMLCLNTANTNGKLENRIGEMIVPYDVDKIVRDTKYFDYDTVIVALELYKKLGLIYLNENGCLMIANYDEMVGSETSSAKRVREWRAKQETQKKALQCNNGVNHNVIQENRDKSLDIRDKDIKDIDKENNVQMYNKSTSNEHDILTPTPSKSKKIKPQKHKHGEYKHVLLTDDEFERLKKDFNFYDELIKKLDEYIETSGKRYKNHNLVLRGWVLNWYNEQGYKTSRKEVEPDWLNEKPKPKEETLEDKTSKLLKMYEVQLKCNQLDQAQETAKQYKALTGKDIEETKKELDEALNVLSKYD